MNDFINEAEVRKAISILKPDNQLFEVRILGTGGTYSGYFNNADTLLEALKRVSLRETNVYITLNDVNGSCYSRAQRDSFRQITQKSKLSTTSDQDIDGYAWLFIDFDPERPTAVSSSKEELDQAAAAARDVYQYLQGLGFEEPLKALSGNGYHLLYRISLENTPENVQLVKDCMDTLKTLFSNDRVHVDTTTTNPSRICKLYGTLAQKGADTDDRPHRMSRVFSTGTPQVTKRMFLEKLVAQVEHEEKPAYSDTRKGPFDIREFMTQHGIGYKESGTGRDNSTVFALDECPFNSSHRNGDAKIFLYPDGKISFLCHHNSCQGKKWQDVRLLYEPDAYSFDRTKFDEDTEEGWKQHNREKQKEQAAKTSEKPIDPSLMFRTAQSIMEDEEPDHEFIRSGISVVDTEMHGLEKQCVSVISGLRGSGKSTLVGTLILQAVQDGHTVVVYSGELANKKYLRWLHRQAAGKANVEVSVRYKNGVGVPEKTEKLIDQWFGDKFLLYDNRFGNRFREISQALEQILTERKADLCIIDNMMALDLEPTGRDDKYDAQTQFVWALKNIAIRTNTHIVFVAHPKKTSYLIRLDDISGAGNIGNIVDNAFLVHRNNEEFKNKLGQFSRSLYSSIDQSATNYVEIAKDREGGLQEYFVPLFYEENSKRLRNTMDENVVYGWQPDNIRMENVTDDVADEIPW